jgi:hypothetical protein
MADKISSALESRALNFVLPKASSTQQRTHQSVSKNKQVASRDSKYDQLYYKSWQTCLQTYSALQWRHNALEAIGIIPSMDDTMYVVFNWVYFEQFGDASVSGREIRALRKLAETIRIFDLITTWYTRGLGAKYEFNPTVELLYYASNAYISAEATVIAYSIIGQSTSTDNQVEEMKSLIKDTIEIVADDPVTVNDYYVSTFYNRKLLENHLVKGMSDQGDGIVKRLFCMIENGVAADGQPHIKFERPREKDDRERFMFHQEWISTIRSTTEMALLSVLRRLYEDDTHCAPHYDHESDYVVFHSQILLSFYAVEDPARRMRHKELDFKKKTQVNQALAYLRDTKGSTGSSLFSNPISAPIAVYVDESEHLRATTERSKVDMAKFKIRKEITTPIVIHKSLLKMKETTLSMNDKFIMDYISIAGGYHDGRRVYAGVNSNTDGTNTVPDHTVRLQEDKETYIRVYNKYFRSMVCDKFMGDDLESIMASAGEEATNDLDMHDKIFPPDQEYIVFTHESNIERVVAKRAFERINPGDEYRKDFMTAHEIY